MRHACFLLALAALGYAASPWPRPLPAAQEIALGGPWKRHTIDRFWKGADGVRLADINRDGRLDIAAAWEESGAVRVYLNPGPKRARNPWPTVTVGRVASPEDAVFFDMDADGAVDVVSSCEGDQRSIFVHWAPRRRGNLLHRYSWRTEPLPAARQAMQWMFAVPVQLDGKNGLDLVAGAKGEGARLGWFEAPENPRRLADWKWHPIYEAGWIMSIVPLDIDGDGHLDLLVSDRHGGTRGVFWLRNPGPGPAQLEPWPRNPIGSQGKEVMFLTTVDFNRDGLLDVIGAVKDRDILVYQKQSADGLAWQEFAIRMPDIAGTAKAVKAGDLDGDGRTDIVFSCEQAAGDRRGVMWMSHEQVGEEGRWIARDISGPEGEKFDLVELIDLDGDGDLDVLTTEETANLGVIWYENPSR